MNTNGREQTVAQHVDNAKDAAQEFVEEAKASGQGLMDAVDLTARVEKNPYGMVAAALGVGYVLGGGLFTPTTSRLLRLSLKLAALPLVRDELMGLAEAAVDGVLDRTRPAKGKSTKRKEK